MLSISSFGSFPLFERLRSSEQKSSNQTEGADEQTLTQAKQRVMQGDSPYDVAHDLKISHPTDLRALNMASLRLGPRADSASMDDARRAMAQTGSYADTTPAKSFGISHPKDLRELQNTAAQFKTRPGPSEEEEIASEKEEIAAVLEQFGRDLNSPLFKDLNALPMGPAATDDAFDKKLMSAMVRSNHHTEGRAPQKNDVLSKAFEKLRRQKSDLPLGIKDLDAGSSFAGGANLQREAQVIRARIQATSPSSAGSLEPHQD